MGERCRMKTYREENKLIVALEGKMDSVHAGETEQEIREAIDAHPELQLCLDAEKLEYISSSGLRSLLKIQKSLKTPMVIRNVNSEVYDIFTVTGFDTLLDVRKKRRSLSVEGCPVIGKGAFGTVYRLDGDTVVKVYKGGAEMLPMIESERDKAKQAFLQGIPTAIPFDVVEVGDQYGAVFEMIDARNCNDLIVKDPGTLSEILQKYAEFLKEIHSQEAKGSLAVARDRYLGYLEKVRDALEENTAARIAETLRAMPEDRHLIHGDVHLKNVMVSDGRMTLIDMDMLCMGNPVFEFAGIFAPYIAFNEDDPKDSMRFMGIPRETAAHIMTETLDLYLDHPGEEKKREVWEKIRLAGYLRFLYILTVEQRERTDPIKEIQIRHAAEHLKELAFRVNTLAM